MNQYQLAEHGSVLATRPGGRDVREAIERVLSSIKDGDVLAVDFAGIVAISPSAADEVFGRLYSELAAGNFGADLVVLTGLTDDHRDVIAPVLSRRGVVALEMTRGGGRLLGAPEHLAETFRTARKMKEFRSSDLATSLGITVSAVDNRLAKLSKSQLLRRRSAAAAHGGREFVYSVPV